MGKKSKLLRPVCIAFLFIFVISIAFSSPFLKDATLTLSRFPLQIISLTFLPYKSLVGVGSSVQDVAKLKQENQSLMLRLMQLRDAAEENKRLRELLSLKQQSHFSVVAARVIAVDASNFKRTLIIDKGKHSGISRGNPVVAGAGMIGMVMEVGASASRIILINDPDFSIAAKDSRSRASGIISGSLEETCIFKYLTLDEDIRVGDVIVSRGAHSRFPFNIPIGEIVSIAKDNSGLTLFAIVKPFVKPSVLEEVLVIIDD